MVINNKSQSDAVPIGPQVMDLLRLARAAGVPVLLIGPTGIGKTELVEQFAAEEGLEFIALDLPLLEPSDLVGLPKEVDGKTEFAPPSALPDSGCGVIVFDEFNRAETYMLNCSLRLLTSRQLHQFTIGPEWSFVACMNPEEEGYSVTPLDEALKARFMRIVVTADGETWLVWAKKKGVHPAVRFVIEQHADAFDQVPPRTWAHVSKVIQAQVDGGFDAATMRPALMSLLPMNWTEILLQALEDSSAPQMQATEVLALYGSDEKLSRFIASQRGHGRTDALDDLVSRVGKVLESPLGPLIADGTFDLGRFDGLLAQLPGDMAEGLRAGFATNPDAAAAFDVKPEHALKGYGVSSLRRAILAAQKAGHWHHLEVLAGMVKDDLLGREAEELAELASRVHVRQNLEKLLLDLGAAASMSLHVVLVRLGLIDGQLPEFVTS